MPHVLRRLAARPAALLRGLAVALSLGMATAGHAVLVGPYLDIPNVPYYVGQSVPPNVLLTLDDSGSMMWGYVPDNFGGLDTSWTTGASAAGSDSIAFKSNLNGLYYRPDVVYTAPTDENGTPYVTSFLAAPHNGYAPTQGTVNLATGYFANQYYDPSQTNPYGFGGGGSKVFAKQCRTAELVGTLCPGTNVTPGTATRAHYWTYTVNVAAGCPDQIPDGTWWPATSCFTFRQVQAGEEQNFAIWYSFYRTRNLATVSAALLAFRNMPASYRVAWQSLNSCVGGTNSFSSACRGWDSSRSTVDARIGVLTDTKRAAMWSWLTRLPAYNGTPLRQGLDRTGQYLQTTGSSSPYADTLGSPSTTYASCRQSFSVMLTDGMWNGSGPSATIGNEDNTAKTLPDGKAYAPSAPYADATSSTLADVAFRYWNTDLQPTLTNNVRPYVPIAVNPSNLTNSEYWDARNDPATWQHMTSFFVGLGISKNLRAPNPLWFGSTFGGSASSPYTGYWSFANGTAWPAATDSSLNNVYDLWHGAVNSRGAFFSVETPDALVDAFKQINSRIAQGAGAAAAVTASSFQVQSDSLAFTASYDTTRWDGTIRAYRIGADGTPQAGAVWNSDTTLDFLGAGKYTSTANKVLVRGSAGGLIRLSDTNLANLRTADKAALDAGASTLGVSTATLVDWILGDDSSTALRPRTRVLGDILGSQPVFENGRDYGYVETAWATPSNGTRIDGKVYADYVRSKSPGGTNDKPTLYFGANDGMLHAINGDTGQRRWSYLPSAMMGKVYKRAAIDYAHDYFVDGPITLHDVHDGTRWRTVLVATFGAGAKGLMAMDVTDPDAPSLLWEVVESDAGAGHVFGEPVIARANGGQWIVAVGNGYGSSGNVASLKVYDVFSGSLLRTLTPTQAAATSAQGMSPPALLYLPGRTMGFAYAGDWQGNLWRFDLRAESPGAWSVDNTGLPLFTARGPSGAVQKISAKPRVISDRTLGRVIVVGTGKLIELTDKDDTSVQTLYGVYDRATPGTTLRAAMTAQTITAQTTTTRTVSANTLSNPAGWYLDYFFGSATGERMVTSVNYMPELSLLLAPSMQPAGGACDSSVNSAVTALSPWTGAGRPVLTVNGTPTTGARVSGMVTVPSVIRARTSVSVLLNRGDQGIDRIPVNLSWNPRAAWRQLR